MDSLKLLPIGGIGTVTKNMYLYELGNEILIVDCGLGFADETMPGIDLLIPDISYLKNTKKKIVGMVLTHGHEDHIGALPFIMPQLPQFPIYASALTAHLANEKIAEFNIQNKVNPTNFNQTVQIGSFSITFFRVTHSILDTSHIFIKTPVGNFYHGSDFKFDFTPVDGKTSDLTAIAKASEEGIVCLLEDCLGAERKGHSRSEASITDSFEEEFRKSKGKIFLTTFASNISRLNQAIEVAIKFNRKVCFLGRTMLKARDIGRDLGYMTYPKNIEIRPHEVKKFKPNEILILLTGSQAQEGAALSRIATENDSDIRMMRGDTVIFSSDPIPGNEVGINQLIDTIAKRGTRVVYSELNDDLHVSGHGSENDIKLLISLTKPKYLLPIGGTYRHMIVYRDIAKMMGYTDADVLLPDNGQAAVFTKDGVTVGEKERLSTVYVDEITGEAVESYVVHDRVKISKEGVVIVIAEVDSNTGQLVATPDILTRGFIYENKEKFAKRLEEALNKVFNKKTESIVNWMHWKKTLGNTAEQMFYRERREPLVIPVILEV